MTWTQTMVVSEAVVILIAFLLGVLTSGLDIALDERTERRRMSK